MIECGDKVWGCINQSAVEIKSDYRGIITHLGHDNWVATTR